MGPKGPQGAHGGLGGIGGTMGALGLYPPWAPLACRRALPQVSRRRARRQGLPFGCVSVSLLGQPPLGPQGAHGGAMGDMGDNGGPGASPPMGPPGLSVRPSPGVAPAGQTSGFRVLPSGFDLKLRALSVHEATKTDASAAE
jgi:hypothetical protein